jgi:hypothetical protein
MSNLEPRGWAAMLYPSAGAQVIGAMRGSKRLHWTQKGARAEAEKWVEEMQIGPITWEIVDDQVLIGRNSAHVLILRSILLPQR